MRTLYPCLALLATLLLFSCSTTDEAIISEEDEVPNNPEVLVELINTAWYVVNCNVSNQFELDGYNECEYFQWVSFDSDKIYVRHHDNPNLVNHPLCTIDGARLEFTRQGCGFQLAPSYIEWEIVTYDDEVLILDVRAPNMNPHLNRRMTFARVG